MDAEQVQTYDVFLSHSHQDAALVEALARRLEDEAGLKVWLDRWEIIPGERWIPVISGGLEKSSTCAIFVGETTTKGWFKLEIEKALNRGASEPSFRVIPVLLPQADIENVKEFLKLYQWVDFRKGMEDAETFHRLVAGIKGIQPGRGPQVYSPPEEGIPEPGPLPPGSWVPFPPNAAFTGRREDLLRLAKSLVGEARSGRAVGIVGSAATRMAAATGMGGIGKTQLAVEFCYRYGRRFDGVHWIQARPGMRSEEIATEVANCGKRMGIEPWPEKVLEQAEQTLRFWRRGGRRLVVFDNLEDAGLLKDWLAEMGTVQALVTARRGAWPRTLGILAHWLEVFQAGESRELLRKLAPRLENAQDAELDGVAQRLGGLPLGIHLAGKYLDLRGSMEVGEYLAELERKGGALKHTVLPEWAEDNPTGHELDLWKTIQASWEQRYPDEAVDRVAREIFLASGYCAANVPILREVLRRAVKAEGEEAGLQFDVALGWLYRLGLLAEAEEGAVIHPLLAEFGRGLGDYGADEALAGLAQALVELSTKALESELPERFVPLQAHLQEAAEAAEAAGLEKTSGLWNNLGSSLRRVAEYEGAIAAFERALRIDEQVYGPEHPNVATDVNNLGLALQDLGDLAGAKAAYQRALEIGEKTLGPEHPQVAIRVNNLGLVLRAQGDLAGAKAAFERALGIDEQVYGPGHPNVATDVNNLGLALQDLGDLAGAKTAYQRALGIDEQVYGPEHPKVATDVNNLGSVLRAQGDLVRAKAAYQRALKIDEQVYGPEHPQVAIRVNNLGLVLQALGDLAGAKAAYERALRIWEQVFGPNHPQVATGSNNLGSVLQAQGDLVGAKAAYQRALRIDEQVYGPEHPEVATNHNNLGSLLQAQGDLEGAKAAYERALKIWENILGKDHPNTATTLNDLGNLLRQLGQYTQAKFYLEQALSVYERVFGENHPWVATTVNNLGGVLQDQGDLARAKAAYERALRIFEKYLPEGHTNIQVVRGNLKILEETMKEGEND